mmetsp:Transcript_21927/g.48767  ORF Transcript_21927/g.48767 Transcript_21927/m.48767 type:complete len:685 (+) Transcript_21927:1698-3752(+)
MEQALRIGVLPRKDVVESVPDEILPRPELVVEVVLGVVPDLALERLDVDVGVPPLHDERPPHRLGMPHVVLPEEELAAKVRDLDPVHVRHDDPAALSRPDAHERHALEVLAPERTAPHEEDALVRAAALEVLPHDRDLVVVPRPEEGADVRRACVRGEARLLVVYPLVDGCEAGRGLEDLLRGRAAEVGAESRELRREEAGVPRYPPLVEVPSVAGGEAVLDRLGAARPLDSLPPRRDLAGDLDHVRRVGVVVQARPVAFPLSELERRRDGEVDLHPPSVLPVLAPKHLWHGRPLERLGERPVLFDDHRALLVQQPARDVPREDVGGPVPPGRIEEGPAVLVVEDEGEPVEDRDRPDREPPPLVGGVLVEPRPVELVLPLEVGHDRRRGHPERGPEGHPPRVDLGRRGTRDGHPPHRDAHPVQSLHPPPHVVEYDHVAVLESVLRLGRRRDDHGRPVLGPRDPEQGGLRADDLQVRHGEGLRRLARGVRDLVPRSEVREDRRRDAVRRGQDELDVASPGGLVDPDEVRPGEEPRHHHGRVPRDVAVRRQGVEDVHLAVRVERPELGHARLREGPARPDVAGGHVEVRAAVGLGADLGVPDRDGADVAQDQVLGRLDSRAGAAEDQDAQVLDPGDRLAAEGCPLAVDPLLLLVHGRAGGLEPVAPVDRRHVVSSIPGALVAAACW